MSIERAYQAFLKGYLECVRWGDASAAAARYAEDAISLPPGEPPLRGRRQIEDHYVSTLGAGLDLTVEVFEIEDFGDTICATGATISQGARGTWLEVLRRAEDGGLKIHRLCFTAT